MRSLFLLTILCACGIGPSGRAYQLPRDPHDPNARPVFDAADYCADSEPVPPCDQHNPVCPAGSTCTDGFCMPVWFSDCRPRCIPKTHPQVLCHGNNEVHGLWTGPPVEWMSVLEPTSPCGGPAWRVYGVKPDPRDRALMDEVCFSTWESVTTFCTTVAPGQQKTPDYFQRNPSATVYLLMGPNYPNAGSGLVEPAN